MQDPDEAKQAETGVTVELSIDDVESTERLPARPASYQDHLPGLEPERHLSDWGRSERIEGLVDRTIYDFLYRYWFRVEVDGIGNVPAEGGALLVANHSGAVPSDGAMIAKAVREEHPRARPVHIATERQFSGLPGLGMLITKLGGVAAHPANLHRLMADEGQVVLLFPEGQAGARKPMRDRYRLQRFDRPGFVEAAIRARVPIVPLALIGAEEALPVLARLSPLRRLTRLPRITLPAAAPLPAKFRIRFLEPILTDQLDADAWRDDGLVRSLSEDVRGLIQENLFEMVGERRSVWLG
jgi:1-acyl-sn-glycerol-3-phosphate acyltransferase